MISVSIHLSEVNYITNLDLVFSSRECQMLHWGDGGHKKKCKKEKVAYDKYCKEIEKTPLTLTALCKMGDQSLW